MELGDKVAIGLGVVIVLGLLVFLGVRISADLAVCRRFYPDVPAFVCVVSDKFTVMGGK